MYQVLRTVNVLGVGQAVREVEQKRGEGDRLHNVKLEVARTP